MTENKLNDLPGKDWIKFTKSWVVYNSIILREKKLANYNRPENRGVSEKKLVHTYSSS